MLYATTTQTPVLGLRRDIDRLFEDAFGVGRAGRGAWVPAVDICETAEELTFAVELSGLAQEDVEVTAENGVLTVRGDNATGHEVQQESRYHLLERSYGTFMRQFQLPQGVNVDKITAHVENGLLLVHIPKTALPLPKRIHVTTGPRAGLHVGANGNPVNENPVNGNAKKRPALGRGDSSPKKVSPTHQAK